LFLSNDVSDFFSYFPTTAGTSTSSSTSAVVLVQAFQFQLTPGTLPRDVIERQLTALKMDDMAEAYRLSSPANQERSGNATNFGKMARSFPYGPLVRHEQSQILMESRTIDDDSQQFLVRVVSSSQVLGEEDDDEDEDEESCSPPLPRRSSSSSSSRTMSKVSEYWWSLSRSKIDDEFDSAGSYMVDAIFPNN